MAATIFIEQDTGTWSGHLHHCNGYSSGLGTAGSEVLRTSSVISRSDVASANTLGANRQGIVGHSHGAAA